MKDSPIYGGTLATPTPIANLDNKEDKVNKVELSSGDPSTYTDEEYPTAKSTVLFMNGIFSGLSNDTNVAKQMSNSALQQLDGKADKEELNDIRTLPTYNLFNVDDVGNEPNYYLNGSGVKTEDTSYALSHKIFVKANEKYVSTYNVVISLGMIGAVYTDSGDYISTIPAVKSADKTHLIYTIPDNPNIAYMRLNMKKNAQKVWMVVKGENYPSEYIPYNPNADIRLSKRVILGERQITQVNDIVENTKTELTEAIEETKTELNAAIEEQGILLNGVNPLIGKKISFNGDSICEGSSSTYKGGYGKIVAEQNGMVYQNIAVGGGTITAETYTSDVARHWICRTIENMDADSDYAIVEGGVNDSSKTKEKFGTITTGFRDALDDTTFCGALESVCKQLVTRFAGKKVGFIIVHECWNGYSKKYAMHYPDGNTDYYQATKTICEKWGVPYLDLNVLCPPIGISGIASLRDTYTKYNADTNAGDGYHPTEEGYRKYYVPKIEAWLKTL